MYVSAQTSQPCKAVIGSTRDDLSCTLLRFFLVKIFTTFQRQAVEEELGLSPKGSAFHIQVSAVIKGTVTRDFCFRFFHKSSSPKPLKIMLGSFKYFFKFSEIFSSQGLLCYQQQRWQILPPVLLVLLIPVAILPPMSWISNCHRNLQPVSKTLVANNRNIIRLLTPLSELKEIFFLYVNSTT